MPIYYSFLRALLFAALFLVFTPVARAQAPTWQMAMAAGGGGSRVEATVADANGNVYIAGGFSGTVGFGSTTLVSAGSSDIFVAKWSTTTNRFVWAQRAGGVNYDYAAALTLSDTNVYVVGAFIGTADFGPASLTSTGSFNVFVAKLTDAGTSTGFTWAVRAGGSSGDFGYAVAVSGREVYVSGFTYSLTLTFGSITLSNTNSAMGFVAKLTDAGNAGAFVWVQPIGSSSSSLSRALVVVGANVYVAGNFSGTATFGSFSLTSPGTNVASGFVAKLADAGSSSSFAWVQQARGTESTGFTALAAAGSGAALYGVGYFGGTAALGGTSLTSVGSGDGFVAKLTDAGTVGAFVWAQRVGGAGADEVSALSVRGAAVYVAGSFSGAAATFGTTTLSSAGYTDAFVTRLTDAGSAGNFVWAQQAGGAGSDYATSVTLAPNGIPYVSGTVAAPASFGNLTIAGPVNSEVGFFASLTNTTGLATASATTLTTPETFPNPAHGRATIQLPVIPGTPTATLTLLDALGRILRTQTAATNSTAEIDLTGLAPGLYAVRVQAGGSTATQRLVVE